MSRRTAKVSEAIREIVSSTILFGLKDPRVKNVTVLWADAAPDLRSARIFVSVRGEAREQSLTLHGLNSARGYIQSQIADKLDLRYTPVLQFVLDPGAKQAAEISSLLRSAMEQTNRTDAEGQGSAAETGEGDSWDQAPPTGALAEASTDAVADGVSQRDVSSEGEERDSGRETLRIETEAVGSRVAASPEDEGHEAGFGGRESGPPETPH